MEREDLSPLASMSHFILGYRITIKTDFRSINRGYGLLQEEAVSFLKVFQAYPWLLGIFHSKEASYRVYSL